MCRDGKRHQLGRILRITNLPAAGAHQPFAKSHDGLRQTGVNRNARNPHASIGPGRGQRDDAGLPVDRGRVSVERSVSRLSRRGIVLHFRIERRVNQLLDRTQCAKTSGQLHDPRAALRQPIANLAIEHHIGTAEFINGLFRIAHHEEFSRVSV